MSHIYYIPKRYCSWYNMDISKISKQCYRFVDDTSLSDYHLFSDKTTCSILQWWAHRLSNQQKVNPNRETQGEHTFIILIQNMKKCINKQPLHRNSNKTTKWKYKRKGAHTSVLSLVLGKAKQIDYVKPIPRYYKKACEVQHVIS